MLIAADYPFMDVFWSMLVFFLWFLWIWLLIAIWTDIFRRDDIGGGMKAVWLLFTLVLPFLGVFVYLVTQDKGMTQRAMDRAQRQRQEFSQYVSDTAGGGGSATVEIERGKSLLDSGVITQAEFDTLKAKALGT
jgi:hypothetical protein